jgi:hypothetical protein
MNRTRVYVATTAGPSEIQRITTEDEDLQSVVCLDGKAQPLPISAAYDAFVRKPTGVIARLTGHGVFRTDVSSPITDGPSWQLGFLLAHKLALDDAFCRSDQKATGIVLATGEVDTDLAVRPVAGIAAKIESARDLFGTARSAGIPLTVLVPESNAQDARAALEALGESAAGATLKAVARADIWDDSRTLVDSPRRTVDARRRTRVLLAYAIAALAFGLSAFHAYGTGQKIWRWTEMKGREDYLSLADGILDAEREGCTACRMAIAGFDLLTSATQAPPIAIRVTAVLPPRFGTCPRSEDIAGLETGPLPVSDSRVEFANKPYCGLRFSVDRPGDGVALVALRVGARIWKGDDVRLPLSALDSRAADTVDVAAIWVPASAARLVSEMLWEPDHSGKLSSRSAKAIQLSGGQTLYRTITVEEAPSTIGVMPKFR